MFVSSKMAAILNFSQKIAKHKNAYNSKIVLDRAISTKCLTRRVSLQSSYPNFKENSSRPKCRPFSIFEILAEIAKHKNASILKTVLDRVILTKFLSGHPNFSKKKSVAHNGGHFEFSNFSQKLQNTKMLISRKPCQIELFRRNF